VAWKLNKKALRRLRQEQALVATPENKPAGESVIPLVVEMPAGTVTPRDFPAGNVCDIKRSSLFLHNDHGKATANWWKEAKGIPA
jgi:hypothetical protein